MKLRYTPQALVELDDILDYVRRRSPQGATRVKSRLLALTRLIQERPYSGQKTSEEGLRRALMEQAPQAALPSLGHISDWRYKVITFVSGVLACFWLSGIRQSA